jgi:predicted membrane-bound dolichyl-phosphate-mannose-protein mannosyltransferase
MIRTNHYITPPTFTTTQRGKLYDIIEANGIDEYVIELKSEHGKETINVRTYKRKVKEARELWNEYINYNIPPTDNLLAELNEKITNEVQSLKIQG